MPVLQSPSRTQPTAIPIFALKWYTHPSVLPMHILAYAGGGGSAKTGIGNTVNVQIITSDDDTNSSYNHGSDGVSSLEDLTASIAIDTGIDIAVALDILVQSAPSSSSSSSRPYIYLAVGIGNFVKIYLIKNHSISHDDNGDNDNDHWEAVEIGSIELEKSSGINTVSWNSTGDALVAGCENGNVCIISVTFGNESSCGMRSQSPLQLQLHLVHELKGHIRAVCCSVYHPKNPLVLMSSAKDGTCRIWNLGMAKQNENENDENDNLCMEELQCRIYDPKGPAPKAANILNPKPGQCLVRGCAFGDLDGRILYTVQSGRKGGAFLSVWKLIRRACTIEEQEQEQEKGPKFVFEFKETMRKQVSNFPVSAMSLSGDYTMLALGDTNGCITLLSTATFQKIKFWDGAHDLPVTCIAARPLPLSLSGEDVTGVRVDAISASADNKLCYLTRQRKSTLKKKQGSGGSGSGGGGVLVGAKSSKRVLTIVFYPIHLIVFAMIMYAIKVSVDVCHEDYEESHHDWMAVKECV
eukprot:CAMPEP_0176484208 /NCGR_PEP_ID=MMETSP0200_2-20121128/4331_1 /TAXON_ID=947934 /ORGANISM="Chaetoceros sp., Strain GSL56" /LENGTH=523 /DNA_ID=CAMNT_0017880665 /DNA_START=53 /DNA_END=1621 /DNA_ORIENTATION=+